MCVYGWDGKTDCVICLDNRDTRYAELFFCLQGLFERHKLIVATQLCMAILKKNGELQQQKFDFLLRGPKVMGMENPLKEWVLDSTWGSVQALKASALTVI